MKLKKFKKKAPKVYLTVSGNCISPTGLVVAEASQITASFKPKLGGGRGLSIARYIRLLKKIK